MVSPLKAIVFGLLLVGAQVRVPAGSPSDALLDAAQRNDLPGVVEALERGADVNAKTFYDFRAWLFAARNANLEMLKLLVERGAVLTIQDGNQTRRAVGTILGEGTFEIAGYLLSRIVTGTPGVQDALFLAVEKGDVQRLRAVLSRPDVSDEVIAANHAFAVKTGRTEIAAALRTALDERPGAAALILELPPATVDAYIGHYLDLSTGQTQILIIQKGGNGNYLSVVQCQCNFDEAEASTSQRRSLMAFPTSDLNFITPQIANAHFQFERRGEVFESVVFTNPVGKDFSLKYLRVSGETAAPSASLLSVADSTDLAVAPRDMPRPWPSFRGPGASGVNDGQGAVAEWDVRTGRNVRWKTPIPGMANASPIVWGERVFIVTAISSAGNHSYRTGDYSGSSSVDDLSEHSWRMYALDAKTGKIAWEREVHKGVPRSKRHMKGSQASATPVTDGHHVVVILGTAGLLVTYDINGNVLWRKDLGLIDSGNPYDSKDQWGHSSSPIIYQDAVILQVDRQKESFLAAYDVREGTELWRTRRDDELSSSFGTPTIARGKLGDEIVTNGKKIRGYDPKTGKLRWTLQPNSVANVPTPVAGPDLVYVTAGYPPLRPIYAIRPGFTGDLSLPAGVTSSEAVAWSYSTGGSYIPTPILYRGLFYTLSNNGVIAAYNPQTGEVVYRARIGKNGGAFTASPVAADGRLYFINEDGEAYVVKAGRQFVQISRSDMDEVVAATPAISDGLIVVRTLSHVYGVGETDKRNR